MQFYEFHDGYTLAKRKNILDAKEINIDEFFNQMGNIAYEKKQVFLSRQVAIEQSWCESQRPYYNVWPVVFDMVEKLKLDIPCSAIQLPPPNRVFCLRLPISNPYKFEGGELRSILFANQKVSENIGSNNLIDGLCLMIDTGEQEEHIDYPVYTFKLFPWRDCMTVDEAANMLPYHESWQKGITIPNSIITQAIKLAVVTCMIYNDPEIVTPDVLARDKASYEEALARDDKDKIDRIIDRAKRRGKNVFDIGRLIDAMPHYRRPHMALFWTGVGRKEARIKLRRGSIVHRDKIVNVPTDYIG
jgi:hypothetical protein